MRVPWTDWLAHWAAKLCSRIFSPTSIICFRTVDKKICSFKKSSKNRFIKAEILNIADWRYRYAGLMTLSSTAEGAHKQMEAYLDQMMDPIVGFLKDPVSNLLANKQTKTKLLIVWVLIFNFVCLVISSIREWDTLHATASDKWPPILRPRFKRNITPK